MGLQKVISGGQTGVDRGALDAAIDKGFPCGGWCPPRRLAEDGSIPEHYPVTELSRGHYRQRTIQNILDSDGTMIIYYREPLGGTEQTLAHAIKKHRPYLLVDAAELSPVRAAENTAAFIVRHSIKTLNVAGPRGSTEPEAAGYTYAVMTRLLTLLAESGSDKT